MATRILVNIGSGNGLMSNGTKPLPEQCWLVSTDQWRLSKGNFTRDTAATNHENQLQFDSNLPGANELTKSCLSKCFRDDTRFINVVYDERSESSLLNWS